MDRKVSTSRTGQCEQPPSKKERETAMSEDGAGRKAVEVTVEEELQARKQKQCNPEGKITEEPIGLEMETAADAVSERSK